MAVVAVFVVVLRLSFVYRDFCTEVLYIVSVLQGKLGFVFKKNWFIVNLYSSKIFYDKK